jgi:NAD(P)H dehydrogenase (quinone)
MATPLATIAVTGASGALGGQVATLLAGAGIPQRLPLRSPEKAPRLPGADVVPFAMGDAGAAGRALEGIETLFMVSGAESRDRLEQHRTLVDAAARSGVRHVVYLSFLAAAPDAVFTFARDHFHTERHLAASGMATTFLRDNFYMDLMPALVGDDGVIRGPAGDGRCSVLARSDAARVAATVLQDILAAPGAHAGASYDLTGPEALSLAEIAGILGEHQGRAIAFHDETVEEARASRAPSGAPAWMVDGWVSTYTAIASGALAPVGDAVEAVTGRPPLSFRQFLAGRTEGSR